MISSFRPPLLGIALLSIATVLAYADTTRRPAAIKADAIKSHIVYLASDELGGRGSGDKGNEMAAKYVASAFKKAGLKPVGTSKKSDTKAKPDGSGYFQPFTFTAGTAVGTNNRLVTLEAGKTSTYKLGEDFKPALVSSSGTASGETVFVGYGVVSREPVRDDYAGADVKGKIVVAMAAPAQSNTTTLPDNLPAVMTARDHGASGLILIQTEEGTWPRLGGDHSITDAGIPVFLIRRSTAVEWLKSSGVSLQEIENPHFTGGKPVALKVQVKELKADVHKVVKTTANVAGLLEGSDPVLKNEIVVVGAHMDHLGMGGEGSLSDSKKPEIHHGADDNASGTAGVLALADYFSAGPRPKRSILFMTFSGEELGLLGSAHYVKAPLIPLDRTVAMLNMDMIGRMVDNKLIVSGSGTSPAWNALIDSVNSTAKFTVARSESGFGASDQQSFYTAKIPVLFFFTGLHSDYHKPSDTSDKINAVDEARVVQMVAECTSKIADMLDRPVYQQIAAAQDSGPARFRVSLGSIPDYAAEVEGVQLSGVRPGSPAEKAGLKAGDIIIKFGDKTIRSVQEYTVALGEHKPGDMVSITVKRGTETVTVTATLEGSKR